MLARLAGWKSVSSAAGEPEEDGDSMQVVALNDSLTITVNDAHISSTVRLYDIQGSLVAVKQLDSSSCSFNVSHLASGIYVVVLSGGDTLISREVFI